MLQLAADCCNLLPPSPSPSPSPASIEHRALPRRVFIPVVCNSLRTPGHDPRNDIHPAEGWALNKSEKRAGARDILPNRSSRAPQGSQTVLEGPEFNRQNATHYKLEVRVRNPPVPSITVSHLPHPMRKSSIVFFTRSISHTCQVPFSLGEKINSKLGHYPQPLQVDTAENFPHFSPGAPSGLF